MLPEVAVGDCVDVELLLREPVRALMPMLLRVPGWTQARESELKASQLSGAMTNLIYRCRYQRGPEKLFALARVFGTHTDDLFSREYEQMIFRTVARAGMGPQLLVSFANGRIEEFYVACNCLSAEQMAEPDVSRALAAAMASFHFASLVHLPTAQASEPQVWGRVRQWLHLTKELYAPGGLQQHSLDNIAAEVDALEERLTAEHPMWLGFCHNDLQCGNIMLDAGSLERLSNGGGCGMDGFGFSSVSSSAFPVDAEGEPLGQAVVETDVEGGSPRRGRSPSLFSSPFGSPVAGSSPVASPRRHDSAEAAARQDIDVRDAKGRTLLPRSSSAEWVAAPTSAIKLIDYEYAGMNAVAFDIANHWCEYAADYDTATPHVLDFSKMPSAEAQAEFVDAYVASLQTVHVSLLLQPDALETVQQKVAAAQAAAGAAAGEALPVAAAKAMSRGSAALESISAQLQAAARAYIPVSHLLWGLWGLIQAKTSEIDFDYTAYGTQRLQEYARLVREAGLLPVS